MSNESENGNQGTWFDRLKKRPSIAPALLVLTVGAGLLGWTTNVIENVSKLVGWAHHRPVALAERRKMLVDAYQLGVDAAYAGLWQTRKRPDFPAETEQTNIQYQSRAALANSRALLIGLTIDIRSLDFQPITKDSPLLLSGGFAALKELVAQAKGSDAALAYETGFKWRMLWWNSDGEISTHKLRSAHDYLDPAIKIGFPALVEPPNPPPPFDIGETLFPFVMMLVRYDEAVTGRVRGI
jgi:hypothetical protein